MEYKITEMQLGILVGLTKFEDRQEYVGNYILPNPIKEVKYIQLNGFDFEPYEVRRIEKFLKAQEIIAAIKYIREVKKGMGLREAKDIADYVKGNL